MTDTVPRNTTQGPAAPYRLPRYEEMPDILLYMDQVLSLMERYLSGLHVDPKTLTASMVNNYVKMGAVPSPEKKKYGREHLCHLMMICLLKSVMPIPSITALIVQGKERSGINVFYDEFCEDFEKCSSESAVQSLKTAGKDPVMTALSCAIRARTDQQQALRILDELK